MELNVKTNKKVNVKYLQAKIGVRYWEDGTINEIEDVEGSLIPCRDGNYWTPLIELETGKIVNWKQGTKADLHYKSCDDNIFQLLDEKYNVISEIEDYVITMMCPNENGYGDYVIMTINEDGLIDNFIANFEEFEDKEEED